MPSLKAIRRRIASVKNTQKITRAMKMVAAARLRRSQQRIIELRPYAIKTTEVLESLVSQLGTDDADDQGAAIHPLLAHRPVAKAMIVTLSGDRGLAGAFNSSILRATERHARELQDEGIEVSLAVLGRKGRDALRRRGYRIAHDYTGAYEGGAEKAAEIAREIIADYATGATDRVVLVYNEFKSAISQRVVVHTALPVQPAEKKSTAEGAPGGGGPDGGMEYLYEPNQKALLARLLPMYVEVTVFRAMLESQASFFGAQMTAMDNATKNAKKMIDSLTLVYNRARQAAITKELMEIIGGAEALNE